MKPIPMTNAQRQARHRERLRTGSLWLRVEVSAEFVHRLVEDGLLDADAAQDRETIETAVSVYLGGVTDQGSTCPKK